MPIKVVEYVHEYEDGDEHVYDGLYAVGSKNLTVWTRKGGGKTSYYDDWKFRIGESNLTIYGKDDIVGHIGLLNKLLEEWPEDGE